MNPRFRRRHAALALAVALFAASPVRAGGPTEPPDGQFAGFAVKYLIPPFLMITPSSIPAGQGQCLWVSCWSSTHDITFGIELWGNTASDPSRAPFLTQASFLGRTRLYGQYFCQQGTQDFVVGRIVAPAIKKLGFECAAYTVSYPGLLTVSAHPLKQPPAKKKR